MRKIILPPSPASPKSYDGKFFITYLSDVGFAKCYSEQHPQQFLTKVPGALGGSAQFLQTSFYAAGTQEKEQNQSVKISSSQTCARQKFNLYISTQPAPPTVAHKLTRPTQSEQASACFR